MKRNIEIIKIYFRDGVSTLAAYRFNLVLSGLANILWVLGQIYYLNFIFDRVDSFNGWSKTDVILLFAFMQTFTYGLFIFIWDSFPHFYTKLTNGEFDTLLLKPINTKFLLTFQNISVAQIFTFVLTVLPLYFIGLSGISNVSLGSIAFAIMILIIAIGIMYFISLSVIASAFFIGDIVSLFDLVVGSSAEFIKVPLSIFPTGIRLLFTLIVPVAFIGYYPALIIKGLENPLPILLVSLTLLILFYLLQRIVWNIGLKQYSGIA